MRKLYLIGFTLGKEKLYWERWADDRTAARIDAEHALRKEFGGRAEIKTIALAIHEERHERVDGKVVRWTFTKGSHIVRAAKIFDTHYRWLLYVNHGDTATTICGESKSEQIMRIQITDALTGGAKC